MILFILMFKNYIIKTLKLNNKKNINVINKIKYKEFVKFRHVPFRM